MPNMSLPKTGYVVKNVKCISEEYVASALLEIFLLPNATELHLNCMSIWYLRGVVF